MRSLFCLAEYAFVLILVSAIQVSTVTTTVTAMATRQVDTSWSTRMMTTMSRRGSWHIAVTCWLRAPSFCSRHLMPICTLVRTRMILLRFRLMYDVLLGHVSSSCSIYLDLVYWLWLYIISISSVLHELCCDVLLYGHACTYSLVYRRSACLPEPFLAWEAITFVVDAEVCGTASSVRSDYCGILWP